MQPLSSRKRLAYLFVLAFLFAALLPTVIFFANGYRFKSGLGFVKTGGIFLSVPYSDAHVFLDGEEVGTSSFLNRTFFVSDLTPGAYEVEVERQGSHPWRRVLVVEEQLVTDAEVLSIPHTIMVRPLVLQNFAASTSITVSPERLADIRAAFSRPSATSSLSTDLEELGTVENGDVYVRWISLGTLPPSRFCGRPSFCSSEIGIEQGIEVARTVALLGGGVVFATDRGIYFSEADVRPVTDRVLLFESPDADFRVIGGALIVKGGSMFYEIIGL